LSGEVSRVFGVERGMFGHMAQTETGAWGDDPWIMDEQFRPVHVRDKGLVVFPSLGRAGVVNILTETRRNPGFPLRPRGQISPRVLQRGPHCPDGRCPSRIRGLLHRPVPCMGWGAVHAFVNAFGDTSSSCWPSALGTRCKEAVDGWSADLDRRVTGRPFAPSLPIPGVDHVDAPPGPVSLPS
jgi:hypothetical protein